MVEKSAIIACLAGTAACALAQSFEISRSTINSGGVMRSAGGAFELSGTMGQLDAGVAIGGGFELSGGFWFQIPPGDCNEDGAANLMDHQYFTECLNGPGGGVLSACGCADLDNSGAVDLRDFALTSISQSTQ